MVARAVGRGKNKAGAAVTLPSPPDSRANRVLSLPPCRRHQTSTIDHGRQVDSRRGPQFRWNDRLDVDLGRRRGYIDDAIAVQVHAQQRTGVRFDDGHGGVGVPVGGQGVLPGDEVAVAHKLEGEGRR